VWKKRHEYDCVCAFQNIQLIDIDNILIYMHIYSLHFVILMQKIHLMQLINNKIIKVQLYISYSMFGNIQIKKHHD